MSVQRCLCAPPCHAHFPAEEYVFLRLFDVEGTYAHAAVAEREDFLELHLESVRWGPRACRSLRQDLAWLQARARSLGKARIAGVRQEPSRSDGVPPAPDPLWARFTRMFGFTGQCVLQAAFLEVEPEVGME